MGDRVRLVVSSTILALVFLLCGDVGAVDLYFSDENANIPGFGGKLMKESISGREVTFTLEANGNIKWFSEPMKEDVVFSAGKWEVKYWGSSTGNHRVYVRLYKLSENGLVLVKSGFNVISGEDDKTKIFELESLTLKKGERICLEINWSKSAGSDTLTLYLNSADHPSGLKTPYYSTLNQIPEFSQLTFVVAVTLAIGGFAILRKN